MDITSTFSDMIGAFFKANERVNLFSRKTSKQEFIDKHIFDSIHILEYIKLSGSLLDVGSGGGLPGLPLAYLDKSLHVTLLDSTQKKLSEITSISEYLGLTNISTLNGRAEKLGQEPNYRDTFDIVTARAVAPLPTLLEITIPFLKVGGILIAYKGDKASLEHKEAAEALSLLKVELQDQFSYTLPNSHEKRTYLVYKKTAKTPSKYPRAIGIPKKNPLLKREKF